ncbi:MAG: hypothetical protein DWB43_07160 [Lautropia sp.]|nr:MAG: hypothetical protein EDM78_00290 [Pseudomonadota bacterium]MBC6959298.1 hypothetical protein [Lautropia sp.]MCZ2412769.1 hypothetical protein [Burkholderiales bacterium]RIK89966.1 MAG: hypothetical protein DCC70_06065 [Burkholderiales bacterium]
MSVSAGRRVVLVRPAGVPAVDGLVEALREAGAQVRELELAPSGDFAALLDALEEGFMPVVLKAPAAG